MNKAKTYIKSILLPLILGGIVGFLISGFMDYNELVKPVLSPPAILFPIVWTILYILMGVSYGILKTKDLTTENIDYLYYIQLAVNLIWPILFFVLDLRFLAFIWILILDVLVIIMTIKFYSKDKLAGILLIPYVLWLLFATYLNLSIYLLNR